MTRQQKNRNHQLKIAKMAVKSATEALAAAQARQHLLEEMTPQRVCKLRGKKFVPTTREHQPIDIIVRIDDYNNDGFVGVVLAADSPKENILKTTDRKQETAVWIKWEDTLEPVDESELACFAGMKYCSDEFEKIIKEL